MGRQIPKDGPYQYKCVTALILAEIKEPFTVREALALLDGRSKPCGQELGRALRCDKRTEKVGDKGECLPSGNISRQVMYAFKKGFKDG